VLRSDGFLHTLVEILHAKARALYTEARKAFTSTCVTERRLISIATSQSLANWNTQLSAVISRPEILRSEDGGCASTQST
jgi:hypothetical protein